MSGKVLGYGIDFGSTNSLIATAYEDAVDVQKLSSHGGRTEMASCMPSVVYFDRHGDYRSGEDALEQYVYIAGNTTKCYDCSLPCDPNPSRNQPRPRGAPKPRPVTRCRDARLAYGLKSYMAATAYGGTDSWGQHFELHEMVSWILRDLRRSVDDGLGAVKVPVVIGVPVKYEHQANATARKAALKRMKQAAAAVGFTKVEFLEEPKAALTTDLYRSESREAKKGAYVAVDFGGGTFDVAVSKSGASPWAADTTVGALVGGELLDSLLFTKVVAPAVGIQQLVASNQWLASRSSMIMGAGRGMSAGPADGVIATIFSRGQVYEFWKSIEAAKIELSTHAKATVDFHRPGVSVNVDVTRQDFERIIAAQMDEVRGTIRKALAQAKVDSKDVALVVSTGGSSAVRAFQKLLEEEFPNAHFEREHTLVSIVEGLGHYVRVKQGILPGSKPKPAAAKVKTPAAKDTAAGSESKAGKVKAKAAPKDAKKVTAPKRKAAAASAKEDRTLADLAQKEIEDQILKEAVRRVLAETAEQMIDSAADDLLASATTPEGTGAPDTSVGTQPEESSQATKPESFFARLRHRMRTKWGRHRDTADEGEKERMS